jgi:hypothetical protein
LVSSQIAHAAPPKAVNFSSYITPPMDVTNTTFSTEGYSPCKLEKDYCFPQIVDDLGTSPSPISSTPC